ncbi:hypothetical protein XANCAGTX0491_007193 [Xanthoria calcicola]
MSDFHTSAEDTHLDGTVLKARLINPDGEHQDAAINLDDILGNNEGAFAWGGSGFSGSAEEIRFDFEGEDNHPALRARLFNSGGEAVDAVVNLAERLGNQNGGFHFE